jgi:pimeloyl-ACP methyl ester carboxylesterase
VTVSDLASGAQLRMRGPAGGRVVLTINGGTARDLPGTWSASTQYLVDALAPQFPTVGFAETKYRIRSWRRFEMCLQDGRAALDHVADAGATEIVLVGFSLGGAVSTQIADHPLVTTVIGLAPWLPQELPTDAMAGRAFHVLHGTRDPLPGTSGVSPASSRAGFDRILAAGATGTYSLITFGIHAIALRAPWGGLIPMPRARSWSRQVARLLADSVAEHH